MKHVLDLNVPLSTVGGRYRTVSQKNMKELRRQGLDELATNSYKGK